MQNRQPMHLSWSIRTIPSSRWWLRPVGQTVTHGASSQWLQSAGTYVVCTSGYVPVSSV